MANQCAQQEAFAAVRAILPDVCGRINDFSSRVLRTRGGRIGSGMGSLLEALWGYYTNVLLSEGSSADIELAWFPGHQFNDFACVYSGQTWNPNTKEGELFRVEAKSMNFDAAESKAHFDALACDIGPSDLLLLLVWHWADLGQERSYPRIADSFLHLCRPIAKVRDELHLARGGTFVDRRACPDGCASDLCPHHGEPLNDSGNRERLSGPETRRPSSRVAYAANFGGLVRMLKTRSEAARKRLRQLRRDDGVADSYIRFIHKNFPREEQNHYLRSEWRNVAQQLGVAPQKASLEALCREVRRHQGYEDLLSNIT